MPGSIATVSHSGVSAPNEKERARASICHAHSLEPSVRRQSTMDVGSRRVQDSRREFGRGVPAEPFLADTSDEFASSA